MTSAPPPPRSKFSFHQSPPLPTGYTDPSPPTALPPKKEKKGNAMGIKLLDNKLVEKQRPKTQKTQTKIIFRIMSQNVKNFGILTFGFFSFFVVRLQIHWNSFIAIWQMESTINDASGFKVLNYVSDRIWDTISVFVCNI